MILTQILLAVFLAILALAQTDNIFITAILAILIAFCSASYDIVFDAYRVEILSLEKQGEGVAMTQLGYRIGMIISSAGALYSAEYFGWQTTYLMMALIVASIGIVTVIIAKEPDESNSRNLSHKINLKSLSEPFLDFMKTKDWVLIILFVISYKLADAFIGVVTNPFLREIGFSKIDIANIVKIYGVVATLSGIFIGGALVERFGAIKIMFIAGFLHAITNLLYMVQAEVGLNHALLATSVVVENLTGGISSAAFIAFLGNLCSRNYTATQYAILSSMAAIGRNFLAAPAGYVVKTLGWYWFFLIAATLAIPALIILHILNKRIMKSRL